MKTLTTILVIIPYILFSQITLDPDVQYDIRNATDIILQEQSYYNSLHNSEGSSFNVNELFVGKTEDEICEIIADIVDVNAYKIKELRRADRLDIPKTGDRGDWVQYKIGDVIFTFHTFYGTLAYWNGKKWKTIQRQQESNYWKPYSQYRVLYSDNPSVFRYYQYTTQTIHQINTGF